MHHFEFVCSAAFLIYPVLAFCQPGAQNSPHDDSLFVLTFPADLSTESLALLFVVNPMTRMLFLFFALVSLVSDAARAIAAQPSKVRISYSSRSNSVTPFWVALQKGFFKEEGLDVELIQVNPRLGAIAVPTVIWILPRLSAPRSAASFKEGFR